MALHISAFSGTCLRAAGSAWPCCSQRRPSSKSVSHHACQCSPQASSCVLKETGMAVLPQAPAGSTEWHPGASWQTCTRPAAHVPVLQCSWQRQADTLRLRLPSRSSHELPRRHTLPNRCGSVRLCLRGKGHWDCRPGRRRVAGGRSQPAAADEATNAAGSDVCAGSHSEGVACRRRPGTAARVRAPGSSTGPGDRLALPALAMPHQRRRQQHSGPPPAPVSGPGGGRMGGRSARLQVGLVQPHLVSCS